MWAGIAAARAGENRFLNLLDKYGKEVVRYCISQYLDAGEQATLRALHDLPKGVFYAEDCTEEGEPIHVNVTITNDECIVDLRGNPKQSATPCVFRS
jgi:N-methylhydantoinase B